MHLIRRYIYIFETEVCGVNDSSVAKMSLVKKYANFYAQVDIYILIC